jgi:hypothetical protein
MSLVRLPDWPALLDAFLQANRYCKFSYGRADCCLFVCDAIRVMTGTDPAAPFRGKYDSLKGALREMKGYCGSASVASVAELVASRNGMPEISPRRAGRGDAALLDGPLGCSLGVVALNGREIVVCGHADLEAIPLARAIRAWRV